MKIAVYSGSFNPMHIGHIAVVRYLLEHGDFDMVYMIVSPQNPFKDSSLRDNAAARYSAAVETVKRQGLEKKVLVDDIELRRSEEELCASRAQGRNPQPSYTIDTMDALQKREPGNEFTLVVGGDNLESMLKWKEGERLLCQYGIAVYPREGYDIAAEAEKLVSKPDATCGKTFRIKLLCDAPLVTVSSTQIRNMIAEGLDATPLLA
ncbi:MAG: nicotinate (nicotinamide) nucleotide adenylyltransferase [Bacteroidales bacterium]|nr:nicotinate (nicotinamide) nucleotide adenylyltransferase [Bacteroidales bacterium]